MSGILKYRDPATGDYLPVPGTAGGGSEEVWVGPDSPFQEEDLWVDTANNGAVYDWSTADARYLTSGFRNVLRNGDMSVAQRGDGPFGNGYTVDGWCGGVVGGTLAITRVISAPGTGSNLLQSVVSGQSAASHLAQAYQSIEDVSTFSGKTVTLSFLAKAASGTPKIGIEFSHIFGSGGSARVDTPITAITLSTTLTLYSVTTTVPSTVGKAIGAGNKLQMSFWFSAGSDYATRASNIGLQNNTFSITDVQLEAGSAASAFERLPVQQQLAWCQRYFQRHGASNPNMANPSIGYHIFGYGNLANVTTKSGIQVRHPVPMRASPTMTVGAAVGNFYISNGGPGASFPSAIALDISSAMVTALMVTHPALATGAVPCFTQLVQNDVANAYLDLSAEL